jgi:hypothetical protein
MLDEELLIYLLDRKSHLLAQPIATWLASSRRFTTFSTTFRDKIRKKLRTTQDQEGLLDLQLELETAFLLLRERLLSLVYEPERSGQPRCPDFAVTFTTSLTFMVEVTRLRADLDSISALNPTAPILPATERLAETISSKLGQLLPQHSNVLLIGVETVRLTRDDLHLAMLRMQQRAERNDTVFLQRHRFRDRAHFFHHYQRLSEILVRRTALQAGEPVAAWANPQAKYPLPAKVRTVLIRSHTL